MCSVPSVAEGRQTHERESKGSREDVVRRLLQRSSSVLVASLPTKDRRRTRASVTELRRELREADLHLYQQRIVMRTDEAASGAPRDRTMLGAATCVVVGVLLSLSGEIMQSRRVPPAVVIPPPPATTGTSGSAAPVAAMPQPAEPASVRTSVASPIVRPPARRSSVKPSSKRPEAAAPPSARPSERRGVLDRLHLRWLRTAFRDDLR